MTIRELNQLYYLKKEIARDEEKLIELRSIYIQSPVLSLMPKGTGVPGSAIERREERIDRLERLIEKKKQRAEDERVKIEEYISAIPDARLRLIFSLRFVDMYSWRRIAHTIGGGNTEAGVKMMCYRYLEQEK